jgi:hypothetical protein
MSAGCPCSNCHDIYARFIARKVLEMDMTREEVEAYFRRLDEVSE